MKPKKNPQDTIIQKLVAHAASDTVNIVHPTGYEYANAIYFGVGGTAVLVEPDNATTVALTVVAGAFIPGHFIRVNATGTTASAIAGCY